MPQPRLTVAIVEDESRARQVLRGLLESEPDVTIVAECAGPRAPAALIEARPQIVFLDVQMPGMDGFQVLRDVTQTYTPVVVFVTAYDRYAIDAFDAAAVDYLLKPFSDERFRVALGRARQQAAARTGGGDAQLLARIATLLARVSEPAASQVVLRDAARTFLLRTVDIDWISADGVYARIYAGKKQVLIRESLASLDDRLAGKGFFRIHRSAIVNVDRIAELRHRSHGDYVVRLRDGTELTLARTRRAALEALLGERL